MGGNPEAQFQLARQCQTAKDRPVDQGRAAGWYRKAAESEHAPAQLALGLMYRQGEGVSRDDEESLRWIRRAARAGEAEAQFHLGVTYHRASLWNRRMDALDPKVEAYKWLQLSARQGFQGAQGACELVCLSMNREEVAAGHQAAAAFTPGVAGPPAHSLLGTGIETGLPPAAEARPDGPLLVAVP